MGFDMASDFLNNLNTEIMDINSIAYDLVIATAGYSLIDMGIDRGIEAAVNVAPVPDNLRPAFASAMTYTIIRVCEKAIRKTAEGQ